MTRGGVRGTDCRNQGIPARRPPAKACALLLPVWGAAHVGKFLDFCLPTLLAPGNIPALAQALPTRFVLLTRSADMPLTLAHPAWRQLAQCCDTDIALIDDLVVDGNHHASVTLAYARALRAAGAAMCDTVFLFLVGDYLVADGSLRSVLKSIQAGASGVLAGSLRVAANAVIPLLRDRRRSPAHDIALPPRLLASWALEQLTPHPVRVERMLPLDDVDTNRLLWSVDEDTLIGRFYLLHMIGIRPEVNDFVVGAPCDYAFVPELCPSNSIEVLTDSDDYFVIEMQNRGAAPRRFGPVLPSHLARSLSQWTTARHRQNAAVTLVFHRRDIPENIAQTCAIASDYVAEVSKALVLPPQPHRGHPSWIGMIAIQRAGGGLPDDCERVLDPATSRGGLTGLLWRLRLRVLGHPPGVTPCHPRWPDFHALYAALRQRLKRGDRLLVLSASAPAFARWLEPLCDDITASEWELIGSVSDTPGAPLFDACLWVVEPEQLDNGSTVIDRIGQVLKPGGPVLIFAARDPNAGPSDLESACSIHRLHPQQSALCLEQAYYVPAGALRLALHRALGSTIRANRGRPRALLPVLLAACALIIGAIFTGNQLVWARRSIARPRRNCSSVVLAGHRPAAAQPAIDCQNGHGYDGSVQHLRVPLEGGTPCDGDPVAGTQITNSEQAVLDSAGVYPRESGGGNGGMSRVDANGVRSMIAESKGARRWARRRG
jgi:hypothetical protein